MFWNTCSWTVDTKYFIDNPKFEKYYQWKIFYLQYSQWYQSFLLIKNHDGNSEYFPFLPLRISKIARKQQCWIFNNFRNYPCLNQRPQLRYQNAKQWSRWPKRRLNLDYIMTNYSALIRELVCIWSQQQVAPEIIVKIFGWHPDLDDKK